MAGICRTTAAPSPIYQPRKKLHVFRCCSEAPKYRNKDVATPQFLKIAVSGVTEILRLFSSTGNRLDRVRDVQGDDISVSCIDDILTVLKSDYEKEYFVSGIFTSGVYVDDCIFEDPTIKFRGKDFYSRNLNLLVPFFDQPSITLQKIEKGNDHEKVFVLASWKLRNVIERTFGVWRTRFLILEHMSTYPMDRQRDIVIATMAVRNYIRKKNCGDEAFTMQKEKTGIPQLRFRVVHLTLNMRVQQMIIIFTGSLTYLKLPWRPLISIDGRTVYDLNDEYKIIRHAESWNVSAIEAIIQIFTPGTTSE